MSPTFALLVLVAHGVIVSVFSAMARPPVTLPRQLDASHDSLVSLLWNGFKDVLGEVEASAEEMLPPAPVNQSAMVPSQLVTSFSRVYDELTGLVSDLRPLVSNVIQNQLSKMTSGARDNITDQQGTVSDAQSRRRRSIFNLFRAPPPPPPLFNNPARPISSDGGAASEQQLYYDYSNVRRDVRYYSATMETIFTLLVALFAALLLPLLAPAVISFLAPYILEGLVKASDEEGLAELL